MRRIIFLLILLALPVFSQAAQRFNMRGDRYCEVILPKSLTTYAVYNTVGLNDCPEALWSTLTPASVKKETGAFWVHLNGPRYWVIDGLEGSKLVSPTIKSFGGLQMREGGVLELSLFDWVKLLFTNVPYKQHGVQRITTWFYDAGKPVYELIDANNNVYVMQSYSIQQVAQTESSLAQLGSKLHLPDGWQFKTGILKHADTVTAINGLAFVVQDDYLNTYQKASHDLLA